MAGNYIGTNAAGTGALPNGGGVFIQDASSNTIGGNSPAARNIISGNGTIGAGGNGVNVTGPATGNRITGNYIGTDVTGTFAVPNTGNGVCLCPGSSGTFLGGEGLGDGNLISGNGTTTQFYAAGVNIVGSNANVLAGNRIGTDQSAMLAVANFNAGISISTSNGNTIGGTTVLARNLISGNGVGSNFGPGVNLNIGSTNNRIVGNWIGTNQLGTGALANRNGGVFVSSPGNTIGGVLSEERNVISGNTGNGVTFSDPAANGNVVAGNYIGTNLNGTGALPNTGSGVSISSGSVNNTIGGGAGARNVISGNTFSGIDIRGNNNTVQGNFIGTNRGRRCGIGNNDGVFLADSASGNLIGGPGSNLGNLISGNRFSGVKIMSLVAGVAGARQTTVQGDLIGTKASGLEALPNAFDGVFIQDAASNTIGGTAAGARNIISGNGSMVSGSRTPLDGESSCSATTSAPT